jgi:hypothetical protein
MSAPTLSLALVFCQEGKRGHVGFRHDVARIDQVGTLPLVGVTATNAMQIRTGTLGAPLERVVIDELASHGVVTITLGLGTERTNHLRVAEEAAFADIDVATRQTHRIVGLDPSTGVVVDFWKKSGTISSKPPQITTSRSERSAGLRSFQFAHA